MAGRSIRIALYADVDMNLVDGSSIWLRSLAEVLHKGARNHVTVVLKAPDRRSVVSGRLSELERVTVVDPVPYRKTRPTALTPSETLDALQALDAERRFDVVILRGPAIAEEAFRRGGFAGRLWVYYVPPGDTIHDPPDLEFLGRMSDACRYILCQTEEVRGYLEGHCPAAADKLVLLPPMIPDPRPRDASPRRTEGSPYRLVYAGKFSPHYCFLEMTDLLTRLRKDAVRVELHVAGDKIHNPPDDPSYRPAVEAALQQEGVVWHKALDRDQLEDVLTTADLALAFRDTGLNESLEISTKVLEYGALGLPVVLTRTPMYEALLGVDYPLFVSGPGDAHEVVRLALRDEAVRRRAASACNAASAYYTFERSHARLQPYLQRAVPETAYVDPVRNQPLRILVAGHDMKFFGPLRQHFDSAGAAVTMDLWKGHAAHDEAASKALLARADVVICEWCLGNAVWYSQHKHPSQRLIVRLHRSEITSRYPEAVSIANVDAVVLVAAHVARHVRDSFNWPADKLTVVANSVDLESLARPKRPDAMFTLGMLGFVPRLKRLDRALDIVELLRCYDERFHLIVKGKPPWDLGWVWKQDDERTHMRRIAERVEASPLLREGVSFEPFEATIGAWMRKIGFLVSTSDIEGNQVSVAEGAASGAVPVILERPGARETYPDAWVHDRADDAAAWILRVVRDGSWIEESRAAREFACREFSPERIFSQWDSLVLGARAPAGEVRA